MTPRARLITAILAYAFLVYIWILLPMYLYEPTRSFHLPAVLWIIHLFTLYIHEAGHFFFRILGENLYILGGSIMQVLAPAAWLVVALRQGSRLAPVALFFTGESLVDVSIYIRDAEFRLLPLLGGSHTRHDWGVFLTQHDLLDWAVPLADVAFYGGLLASLGAIAWGIMLSIRLYRDDTAAESAGVAGLKTPGRADG